MLRRSILLTTLSLFLAVTGVIFPAYGEYPNQHCEKKLKVKYDKLIYAPQGHVIGKGNVHLCGRQIVGFSENGGQYYPMPEGHGYSYKSAWRYGLGTWMLQGLGYGMYAAGQQYNQQQALEAQRRQNVNCNSQTFMNQTFVNCNSY